MSYSGARWIILGAAGLLLFAGPVTPQTCDSLQGATNCNTARGKIPELPPDRESDWDFSYTGGNQGLGSDLLTGRKDDAAMLGGIVFGRGGWTCSGPFRSRKC
jgi:hypothetical protein